MQAIHWTLLKEQESFMFQVTYIIGRLAYLKRSALFKQLNLYAFEITKSCILSNLICTGRKRRDKPQYQAKLSYRNGMILKNETV